MISALRHDKMEPVFKFRITGGRSYGRCNTFRRKRSEPTGFPEPDDKPARRSDRSRNRNAGGRNGYADVARSCAGPSPKTDEKDDKHAATDKGREPAHTAEHGTAASVTPNAQQSTVTQQDHSKTKGTDNDIVPAAAKSDHGNLLDAMIIAMAQRGELSQLLKKPELSFTVPGEQAGGFQGEGWGNATPDGKKAQGNAADPAHGEKQNDEDMRRQMVAALERAKNSTTLSAMRPETRSSVLDDIKAAEAAILTGGVGRRAGADAQQPECRCGEAPDQGRRKEGG